MPGTENKFAVGAQGKSIVISLPSLRYSYDDAILLAAWLVAMAEPFASRPFADVLKDIERGV